MPFWLRFALREARASAQRLGVYMGAITLGVAALVAINSFRAQVVESVDTESRALLGADLRVTSNRAFSDTLEAIFDSAATAGVPLARVTGTLSIILPEQGAPVLVQVRAVDGPWPFYGNMVTEPGGEWERLPERGRVALLEAGLASQLDLSVGDSVAIGEAQFDVAGVLTELPPEISFRNAIGPRVFIHADNLDATGLLRFGSLVQYEVYFRIPENERLQRFVDVNHGSFRRAGVDFDTAADQAENLAEALEALGRFLGLVGLSALLLGGLGVASAVHVFVKDKRRVVATLRCLGATQRTAFTAYMFQATALGTTGALLGAILGVAIQAMLPSLIGDALPIEVPFSVQWGVVFIGVAIGTVVAAAFSLLPLLAVRGISPLQALRHDFEAPPRRFDPWRLVAAAVILASIVALAVWQARLWQVGVAYAAALAVGMFVLWLSSMALVAITRRLARSGSALLRAPAGGAARRRSFAVRQGVANLFRPRNQTTSVTMALGFGVFLVATLWITQRNLLNWMRTDASRPQPNLVLFDIQRDQVDTVRSILQQRTGATPDVVPIVPARLAAINGVDAESLLLQQPPRAERWAVRREYRHTYRDTLTGTEEIVAGEWFDRAPAAPSGMARVSIERDVADDLGVGVGDSIRWDVSGVAVIGLVTSIRSVDWARFETNFFFVFEPGALDAAPQTAVSLVSLENDSARAATQRAVVERFPNVSAVDIAAVRRMLQRIVDRMIYAIRFMAGFSVAAGALVLVGAVAASRFQRVRESALLRALGAGRNQIRIVLLVEYAAMGALAAVTGIALAVIAGWLLMRFVFNMPFNVPVALLAALWVGVSAAAALIGMLNSRDALRSTPLAALRDAEAG